MNELQKTLACVVVAVGVLALVGFTRRPLVDTTVDSEIGQPLFPDFKDPLAARSLEIINFDEETSNAQSFKVEQRDGVWSLPSHYNYPADAEDQMAEAAASLVDLKIAGVASVNAKDHGLYGVVDPELAEVGAVGVGKRVTLKDGSDKKLVDLIIGKEVADAPTIRYVRRARKDPVYRVKVSADKLSTKFEDWIEDDLLKLNAWDIRQVTFNNYSVDEVQGTIKTEGDPLVLTYDDKDLKWSMDGLAEGEELDTETLNGMKTAVDDLKIVDVQRKPPVVSPLLSKAAVEMSNQEFMEMRMSLQSKGFYFNDKGELFSNQGEVIVGMKDGVQYTLRFGEIALGTGAGEKDDESSGEEGVADGKGDDGLGINRYIMVSTEFNEDLIPMPEPPAEEPATEEAPGEDAEGEAKETPQKEPEDGAPNEASPDEPGTDEASPENAGTDEAADDQSVDEQADAAALDVDNALAQAGPDDPAPPAENTEAEAGADEAKPGSGEPKEEKSEAQKEYERKLDERAKKIEEGKKQVDELNERFGPWYYVISDEVYKKVRLDRSNVVKINETPAGEGDTPEDFESLKRGLEP